MLRAVAVDGLDGRMLLDAQATPPAQHRRPRPRGRHQLLRAALHPNRPLAKLYAVSTAQPVLVERIRAQVLAASSLAAPCALASLLWPPSCLHRVAAPTGPCPSLPFLLQCP